MNGCLGDAPEWATHYVESKVFGRYWFVDFINYRWTMYDEPYKEFVDCDAMDFVEDTLANNPEDYLIIELNFSLENE